MDIETIKEAKELEARIEYCRRARNFAKDATAAFFNGGSNLGFYIGYPLAELI